MDFLLKVAPAKYTQDMYEKEYLYFNTFARFRAKEKDATGRDDPREGNTKTKQMRFLEITDPSTGKKHKLHEMLDQFNSQYNEFPTVIPNNLCSLYILRVDDNLKYNKIDDRILTLGDKTILIYDIHRFFEVLDKSLEDQGLKYRRRPIDYYDYKTFDGELTFHHKESSFSFQKEYRIMITTPGKAPMNIPLPGLKNFSSIVDTNKLNSLELKIGEKNDLQQNI